MKRVVMKRVGVLHAKKHLSQLLAGVERGERVTITRRGRPQLARKIPVHRVHL